MAAGPVSVARRQLRCHAQGADGRHPQLRRTRSEGLDGGFRRFSYPLTCGDPSQAKGTRTPDPHTACVKTPVLQRVTASTVYRIMPPCNPSSY
jgi:hypothetical protein